MFRIGIFLIALFFMADAKNIEVDFSVEYGIVGEVAKSHSTLITKEKSYIFESTVDVVGKIAKIVTGNLKERHISKGHIKNSLFVSDMYQVIKSYEQYTSTTIYRINHKKKTVTRTYKKWENGKEIIEEKRILNYYSRNDMITLLLNLPKHIKHKYKSKEYKFKAVGADRKNGRVDIVIPTHENLKAIKNLLDKDKSNKGDWYCKVVMHRKLYNSEKGELLIKIDQDGIVDSVVLKDLIFFGDIRIIRQ
ncbi:MAG: hypothetical protein COA92_05045 [Sulfurovum sp.]|nr:MAG: hypothetical protein COA92_05045 [Sulfurovum sp.]